MAYDESFSKLTVAWYQYTNVNLLVVILMLITALMLVVSRNGRPFFTVKFYEKTNKNESW